MQNTKYKKIQNTKCYSSGLTLIELLIVVVIIAIIWIVMIDQYEGRIELAKKVTCAANIRVIQGQLEIYEAKTGHYPRNQKEFDKFLRNDDFFAEFPVCPFIDPLTKKPYPYTYNTKTFKVIKHTH